MEVLNLLLSLISGTITWFFSAEIYQGVTLGWIFLSVLVAGFLIKTFIKGSNDE